MLVKNNYFIIACFISLVAVLVNYINAADIVYPYYATPERRSAIDSGFAKIKKGLTDAEVTLTFDSDTKCNIP